jgi:transcriptional regulator with XRE-family HTH domain
MLIGKTIRKLRVEQGLSQLALAHRAKLTPSFLSLVENDRRNPSLLIIERLARALRVPEEVIFWDSVELPSHLSIQDRKVCEAAKLIVRFYYESVKRDRKAS